MIDCQPANWTSAFHSRGVIPFDAVQHCMPTALGAEIHHGLGLEGAWLQLLHLYGVETPNRGILRKS